MLYYLFSLLKDSDIPGVRLMTYITFRSGIAFVLALLLAIFVGRTVIHRLQKMQIGEIIRDLDLAGQMAKTGTPTMGGIIIIFSIIVPCLLMGNLSNVYMLLMLLTTMWLGLIGFLDDYLKLRKHNKDGMKGKYKIVGQVGIALIVGITMYLNPSMTIVENREIVSEETNRVEEVVYEQETIKSPQTTIPFVKNNNFNYSWLTSWMGRHAETGGWIVFVLITIFLVSATSNGANLNERTRRHDSRSVGNRRGSANTHGISGRQHHILVIPQHHVCARQRGARGIYGRVYRCPHRLPVV